MIKAFKRWLAIKAADYLRHRVKGYVTVSALTVCDPAQQISGWIYGDGWWIHFSGAPTVLGADDKGYPKVIREKI